MRKRAVPHFARRFGEQDGAIALPQGWCRVLGRAPAFERIAAVLDLAADVTGFAGCTAQLFESVVIGFEFIIADRPILNGHVGWKNTRAIPFLEMSAQTEIGL